MKCFPVCWSGSGWEARWHVPLPSPDSHRVRKIAPSVPLRAARHSLIRVLTQKGGDMNKREQKRRARQARKAHKAMSKAEVERRRELAARKAKKLGGAF